MRIINVTQGTPEWLRARRGLVTATKLKGLDKNKPRKLPAKKGTVRTAEWWNLLAERRYGVVDEFEGDPLAEEQYRYESARERGHRLEPIATALFAEATGKECRTDIGICVHSKFSFIAYSPDALVRSGATVTEDVEVKCLATWEHVKVHELQEIPEEFHHQKIQAFIVNPKLQCRWFVFYDPRCKGLPLHWIAVERSEVLSEVKRLREVQITAVNEIDKKE